MIALICKFCKSKSLIPKGYFEAECQDCGKHLHLWEMLTVWIQSAPSEDLLTTVSEPTPAPTT